MTEPGVIWGRTGPRKNNKYCECGNPGSTDPDQVCPYQEEVMGEMVPCTCCEECYNECLADI